MIPTFCRSPPPQAAGQRPDPLDRVVRQPARISGGHRVLQARSPHRGNVMHPDGGPELGLTLDPDRARAAAGFDYFSIGVPDRAGLDQLAPHLTALGEEHAGVHFATIGWILPLLHDPATATRSGSTRSNHTRHWTPTPPSPSTTQSPRRECARPSGSPRRGRPCAARRIPCHERVGPSVRAPRRHRIRRRGPSSGRIRIHDRDGRARIA